MTKTKFGKKPVAFLIAMFLVLVLYPGILSIFLTTKFPEQPSFKGDVITVVLIVVLLFLLVVTVITATPQTIQEKVGVETKETIKDEPAST